MRALRASQQASMCAANVSLSLSLSKINLSLFGWLARSLACRLTSFPARFDRRQRWNNETKRKRHTKKAHGGETTACKVCSRELEAKNGTRCTFKTEKRRGEKKRRREKSEPIESMQAGLSLSHTHTYTCFCSFWLRLSSSNKSLECDRTKVYSNTHARS